MAVLAIAICIDHIYARVRAVNPIDWLVYRYGSDAAWHRVDVYTTSLHGPFIDQPNGMPFTYTPFASLLL